MSSVEGKYFRSWTPYVALFRSKQKYSYLLVLYAPNVFPYFVWALPARSCSKSFSYNLHSVRPGPCLYIFYEIYASFKVWHCKNKQILWRRPSIIQKLKKKCKQTRMAHVHPRRRSNKLVNERRLRSSYFYHFMRHGCVCDFSSTSSVYNVSLLDISNKINFIRHASCWDPRKWYAKPLNTLKVSAYMRSIMLSAHFLSSHGQQIVKVATSVNAIDIEWNR